MSLRRIPIRRVGSRETLFMGGDRELVMLTGLLSFAMLFSAVQVSSMTLRMIIIVSAITLWVLGLAGFRKMAKADSKMRHVYLRNNRYKHYYSARSTPYRNNTRTQGKQYRQ